MSGSIGYAIRVESLSLQRLRREYPDGPPETLKGRARDIGWSEALGWPEEVLREAPPVDPIVYLFDVPGWLVEEDWLNYEVLEFLAGRVKFSKLRAQWRAWRLAKRLGRHDIPLPMALAADLAIDEVDEWVTAAFEAYPTKTALKPMEFLEKTLPAAAEARELGMPVNDFAEYVCISGGRIPAGALTAGVPAEYAAVL